MFVLTQNRSPRAEQILTAYAKGAGNPDLQMKAIRYIGMSGTSEARQQLSSIYSASNDANVKRQILQSLTMSNSTDALSNLAKNEKDPELKKTAVSKLSLMHSKEGTDYLMELLQK